jgi:hypothetical protein
VVKTLPLRNEISPMLSWNVFLFASKIEFSSQLQKQRNKKGNKYFFISKSTKNIYKMFQIRNLVKIRLSFELICGGT